MHLKTMTLQEFLHKDEIEALNKIQRNRRLKKIFVMVLAFTLTSTELALASQLNVDKKGNQLVATLKKVARYACIIMALLDIIKSTAQGDTKSIGKIVAKYLLAYATIYIVPLGLDWIDQLFS